MKKDLVTIVWGDSIVYGWHDNELGGWVNRLKINLSKNRIYYWFLFFHLSKISIALIVSVVSFFLKLETISQLSTLV